ncbi:MAG: hypothetical protein Q4P32_07545 [Micrococcales bacterium]|nr:hypothetical protein [Micrococcales bacterium]
MPLHSTAVDEAGGICRRKALRGGVLLGALAVGGILGGCGLRLERSAPSVPLLPAARPYPGADALRAELARCRVAQEGAQDWSRAGGPALARTLVQLHAVQIDALEARLREVHETVPTPSAASPGSTPAPTARSAGGGTGLQDVLLAAERAGIAGSQLASTPAADRSLLAGCLVGRAQAARLLGAPALAGPRSPQPASPEEAAELLGVVHPVLYGLEVATAVVVVARAPLAKVARLSLTSVQRQRQVLVQAAGSSAPAPRLGYTLPGPIDTAPAAQALARDLLSDLADAYLRMIGRLPQAADAGPRAQVARADGTTRPDAEGADLAAAIAGLLGWAREAEFWRGTWGAPPRAVPGG